MIKTFCHSSFEFQTRNYITCFGHICNHPHGQDITYVLIPGLKSCLCIFVYGSLGREDGCRCNRNT